MKTILRSRTTWVLAAVFGLLALVGGSASAVALATGPGTADDHAYNTVVHICISNANESVAYFEEHTSPATIGNCAAGYTQAEINAPYLAPAFQMTLHEGTGSSATTVILNCSASQNSEGSGGTDPNQITALSCSVPSTSSQLATTGG